MAYPPQLDIMTITAGSLGLFVLYVAIAAVTWWVVNKVLSRVFG